MAGFGNMATWGPGTNSVQPGDFTNWMNQPGQGGADQFNIPTAKGIDWFGKEGIAVPGIKALTGVGQLALGFSALGEQKKANRFSQSLARANLANQGSLMVQELKVMLLD